MAVTQLGLYNGALLLLGQRALSGTTEDRPPRYALDTAYGSGNAALYCLEVAKPVFARVTAKLSSPATSSVHDLDSVHTLPNDFAALVGVYSDAKLDQEINRFIIESGKLACEYATVYIRYISSTPATTFTYWSIAFERAVQAYLAREACIQIAPAKYEDISALFNDRIKLVMQLNEDAEPAKRTSATTVTLTSEWRNLYNGALQIMGLDEITANDDDSNRRTKLDRALDAKLVLTLLEHTGWNFARSSTKMTYNPSLEPDWGFQYVFDKPSDMTRLYGLFIDEYMQVPLEHYHDEGDQVFADVQYIYISYVDSGWADDPSAWPPFFWKLVAARLANDAAPSLRDEGADVNNAKEVYKTQRSESKSIDAMNGAPRHLRPGKWRSSRYRGSDRNRP